VSVQLNAQDQGDEAASYSRRELIFTEPPPNGGSGTLSGRSSPATAMVRNAPKRTPQHREGGESWQPLLHDAVEAAESASDRVAALTVCPLALFGRAVTSALGESAPDPMGAPATGASTPPSRRRLVPGNSGPGSSRQRCRRSLDYDRLPRRRFSPSRPQVSSS
jgi:hypothetical protein